MFMCLYDGGGPRLAHSTVHEWGQADDPNTHWGLQIKRSQLYLVNK